MDEQNDADIEAELSAVNAEIDRLTQKRNELLARRDAIKGPATQPTPTKADWYPDPFGRFTWRYRDERGWTSWVARDGVTSQDPPGIVASPATSNQWAPPTTATQATPTPTAAQAETPEPTQTRPAAVQATPATTSHTSAMEPTKSPSIPVKYDVDIGKLMLIIGAALVIGGIAGLTAWLWTRLPSIGRLGLLGVAAALQVGFAMRIRQRLQTAAEAFAATGAATMLFAVASVAATAKWDGTIGVVVGLVGIALLMFARFRAWVIAGYLAIAVGAVAVLVAEPWAEVALVIAAILGALRVSGLGTRATSRVEDLNVYPQVMTAASLLVLLSAPVLALGQYDAFPASLVFIVVTVALGEIAVRSRAAQVDHQMVLFSGAIAAIGGVVWSTSLWVDGSRADGLVGMSVTGVVALMLWRVGRTEPTLRTPLLAFAVGLVPVAARFASDPGSHKELVVFCGAMVIAGLAAIRFVRSGASRFADMPTPLCFWAGALVSSSVATEQLAVWPRLGLLTVALASVATLKKLDVLRYLAALAATATVGDFLYSVSPSVSWWFRPDMIGLSAALFLFVANSLQAEPRSISIGSWKVPRYWESVVALLVVPVSDLASRPALLDLPSQSRWRVGALAAFTTLAWLVGVIRRERPNSAQWVSLLAVLVVVVSRVSDVSPAVRSGAWIIIGCVATAILVVAAKVKKVDELRYLAAATATATVAVLLFGDLIQLTWWFRPDLLGVAAAVFLWLANRSLSQPPSFAIESWKAPRYWESFVALLAVPVCAVAASPALLDLPTEALWRLGALTVFTMVVWGIWAVRRERPNSAQLVSLLGAAILVVSRVADDSPAVRSSAWIVIGCVATAVLAVLASVKKVDTLRYAAAATATATVAVLLFGDLFQLTWWFRPDLLGAAAAAFLYVANRTHTTPPQTSIGSWVIPRFWESATALLVVPVVDLMAQPALLDLPLESKWRLGLVAAFTIVTWAIGAVRRSLLNSAQLISLVAVAAITVSRVGDESMAVRSGAWVLIGGLATIVLMVLASVKKLDDLRYAAAVTATLTVAVLLYGDLFQVTWWFRPDLLGAAAAVFLSVASRMHANPRTVSVGSWVVPKYWESGVAVLAVPVADLVSQPAFLDLSSESRWRLGLLAGFTAAVWLIAAVRRAQPNSIQLLSLMSVAAVVVSRVADESPALRMTGWIGLGLAFVAGALASRRAELLVPGVASWMAAIVMYSPPGPLETTTLSFAGVAVIGAVLARRFGRRGSFDFIPATALTLLPSAFAAAGAVLNSTLDSGQVTRIAAVLVVGAVWLAYGTVKRLAALVGPSVVALGVLAVAQLIVVQRQASGWVSALLAGVVLLAVGTRLEYMRSVSRRAADLVKSLR